MAEAGREHDTTQRTEMPSALRLQTAREEGFVAKSGDLSSAVMILGSAGLLAAWAPVMLRQLREMMITLLDARSAPLAEPNAWLSSAGGAAGRLGLSALLLAGGLVLFAAVAGFLQVGPIWARRVVLPQGRRLSPAEGIRRLVSLRAAVRIGFSLAKLALGAWVLHQVILPWARSPMPPGDAQTMASAGGEMILGAVWRLGLGLAGLGILDGLYQRWQHRRDLRMTRQEVREERRQAEGGRRVRRPKRRITAVQAPSRGREKHA